MKRQLTRKLSTAEFAHSHSGPRPTSDPAPIPMRICTSLEPCALDRSHTHMPITYQYWGSAAPPPASLQSPPGAALPLARSAARHGAWAEGDGAWRERRRRAAAGRRAKTSKMATPCGHQPTYRGAAGFPAIDVWGYDSSSVPALYRCHLSRAHALLGRPRDVAGPHRRGVCERGGRRTRL